MDPVAGWGSFQHPTEGVCVQPICSSLLFNVSTARVVCTRGGAGDRGMALFQCLFLKQPQIWRGTILWRAAARPGGVSGHGEEFEVSRERAAHPKHSQRTGVGLFKPPPALKKGQLRTGILAKTEIWGDTTICSPWKKGTSHQSTTTKLTPSQRPAGTGDL